MTMTKTKELELTGIEWINIGGMLDREIAQCMRHAGDPNREVFYVCATIPVEPEHAAAYPYGRCEVVIWLSADDVMELIAENPTVPVRVSIPWQVFDTARRVQPCDYDRVREWDSPRGFYTPVEGQHYQAIEPPTVFEV
jgi:hypothetical protein